MKKFCFAALAASAALGLGGCATVMNGTKVDYKVDSEPSGAAVKFTSGQECKTPCKLELKRKDDQRVDITKAGYEPAYVLVQSKLGGSAFGNIILGGVVGGVVDGSNGASNRLYPRPLNVRLAPAGSGEEAMLLDKDGAVVSSVAEHNNSVRLDVAKTIGAELAGIEDEQEAGTTEEAAAVSEDVAESSDASDAEETADAPDVAEPDSAAEPDGADTETSAVDEEVATQE